MKIKRWQRIGAVLAVCGLAAGVSTGATIRYRSTGDWTLVSVGGVGSGWQEVYPTVDDIGRGNWGNNTVTLTTTESIGAIQWGVDEPSHLMITGTGNLTTGFTNSCGMGYGGGYNAADSSTVTIESGGVLTVNTNWNMGWTDAGDGGFVTLDINAGGTMTVTGEYIQNSTKVVGSTIVDGTLNVGSLTLGNARILNIGNAGKVVIASDATAQVEGYVAAGTLLGNNAVSNVNVTVETNLITGVTNTTISAKQPAVPNYVGLYIDVALAKVLTDGFSNGTTNSSYVRGVNSGIVLSQNPLAGDLTTPTNSPIDLTHQEIAPLTTNDNTWAWMGGNSSWTNQENWTAYDVPLRETQLYLVRIDDLFSECVLNTTASVARLRMNGGNLKLANGADLYAGKLPSGGGYWTSVGYDTPSTLTIEEGAKMETAAYLITGFTAVTPGVSTINLNGGDLIVGGNIQMGSEDQQSSAVINISSGSVLTCTDFKYRDGVSNGTYSVVHLYDGTIIQNPTQTNTLQRLIDDGAILIHSPSYSLSVIGGKAVLQTTDVGFGSWAAQYGLAAGTEMIDSDSDGFKNLYEYAFDGNPTNNAVHGEAQVLTNAGGVLTFTFVERNDDPKLTYSVETTDNLVSGTWVAVGYTTETGRVENVGTGGKYDLVTHTIPVTDARKFVRVKVSQAP